MLLLRALWLLLDCTQHIGPGHSGAPCALFCSVYSGSHSWLGMVGRGVAGDALRMDAFLVASCCLATALVLPW